jgi:hypothetical protein
LARIADKENMKIRVQHKDGSIETIRFKGAVRLVEGSEMNRICTESGLEHFFTKDGYYDGWGGAIEDSQRAEEIFSEVESRREVDGRIDASPATQ